MRCLGEVANRVSSASYCNLHPTLSELHPGTTLGSGIPRMCLHLSQNSPLPRGPPWDSILVTFKTRNYSLVCSHSQCVALFTVRREGGEWSLGVCVS